jgi:hypothetical protein
MISERLLHAPDLVAKSEFEKTTTGKRLVATTFSSRALGLEVREEPEDSHPAQISGSTSAPTADEVEAGSRSKRNRKEED